MTILIKEWRTFNGKTVTRENIDHQHLSNIYWYFKLVFKLNFEELSDVLAVCSERFNGQLLDYRPHIDFVQEIHMLYIGDYLVKSNAHEFRYLIRTREGKVIGYIQHPDIENILDVIRTFKTIE